MTDPRKQPERRFWKLTPFEWIMSVLTFLGLLIAFFTGLILRNQLNEMKVDQKAWMTLSIGTVNWPKDVDNVNKVVVTAPAVVTNIGKTAARNVHIQVVMEYVVNGSSPDFVYDGRVRSDSTTGIMFPNSPLTIPVVFSEQQQQGGQPT